MKIFDFNKKFLTACLLALFLLVSCSTTTQRDIHRHQFVEGMNVPDYILGGANGFCHGSKTDKAYVDATFEVAQGFFDTELHERRWRETYGRSSGITCNSGPYYYFYTISARWKLKDGREFIIDRAETRPIIREFFKTQDVLMPWDREKRPRKDDLNPGLVMEFREDHVQLYWWLKVIDTPVSERWKSVRPRKEFPDFKWQMHDELYPIGIIKGVPTTGIDFDKRYERLTPQGVK
jgi:hypothetical protein